MSDEALREEFEAWAASCEQPIGKQDGVYEVKSVDCLWLAWRASREVLVIELPNRYAEKYQDYYDDVEGGCFNEARYINDLTAAIDSAGVKVKP